MKYIKVDFLGGQRMRAGGNVEKEAMTSGQKPEWSAKTISDSTRVVSHELWMYVLGEQN